MSCWVFTQTKRQTLHANFNHQRVCLSVLRRTERNPNNEQWAQREVSGGEALCGCWHAAAEILLQALAFVVHLRPVSPATVEENGGGNAWTFSFTHSLYDLCHFRIIQLHLPAFFAGSELLVQAHVTAVWWKNPAVGDCSLELINIPKFCVSLFVNPSLQLPSIAAYLSTFLPSAFSSVNEKFCWGFGWGDWIYYETKFHFHLRKKIHFLYLQNVLACVFSSPSIWERFCWIGLNVNINSRLYIVIESLL